MRVPSAPSAGSHTSSLAVAEDLKTAHYRMNRLLYTALTLMVMLALKRHYSAADANQLVWMLAPAARLTTWLTSAHLVWESGTGFVDFNQGIIIAPACAGINFMIMAFGLGAFCGLMQLKRLPALLLWILLAFSSSYTLALVVNTLRIVLSIHLYQADIYSDWLTPDRLHRIAGVLLYLGALGLFFKGLQPIMAAYGECFDPQDRLSKGVGPTWLPYAWYLLGTVGVPAAHLLLTPATPGFGEHCLTVLGAGAMLWCGVMMSIKITKAAKAKRISRS